MSEDHYTYRVTWSPEDGEYVGLCLEFPSLSWLAATRGEAFVGICKLVEDVLVDLAANDEPVPEPLASRAYSGKFVVRVPPETHRELVVQAAEEGISLNRLVNARLTAPTSSRVVSGSEIIARRTTKTRSGVRTTGRTPKGGFSRR